MGNSLKKYCFKIKKKYILGVRLKNAAMIGKCKNEKKGRFLRGTRAPD